jgi:hypothetical protein
MNRRPEVSGDGAVQIKGTAYSFGYATPIAGATIRAVGAPGASATSGADGSYALTVPDRSTVTPYIEADGFHTIFQQTFTMHGRDLWRVNFQTPTEDIYLLLAATLGVQLDENGDPARCAIVTTATTKEIRDLTFPEYAAFGVHGVPGTTASTSPRLPDPLYFNADVSPDPSLTETSADGGIVWTEVPRGTYTVTAKHPSERLASFTATCRDGRIVNASPPWGLYQLRPGELAP